MDPDREVWKSWAQALKRRGAGDWTADLLEAAGPLTVVGAQFLHFGRPFIGGLADEQLAALARLLEEPERARSFAAYLREANLS
jgi:hypothetical protein